MKGFGAKEFGKFGMKSLMARKLAWMLAACCILSAAACWGDDFKVSAVEDLKALKLGTQRATIAEGLAREMLGDKAGEQLTTYEKATDVITALKIGKVQAVIMDDAPANRFLKDTPGELTILPEALTTEQYAIGFKKGNTELCSQVNKAMAEIRADGTLAAIFEKYSDGVTVTPPEEIDVNKGAKGGKLYMGTESGFPPYDIKVGEGYTGIDVEMAAAIARKLDKELVVIGMTFDSLPMAVNSGKVDMICAGITVTEDRKKNIEFSDPYVDAKQVAVVMTKNYAAPAK